MRITDYAAFLAIFITVILCFAFAFDLQAKLIEWYGKHKSHPRDVPKNEPPEHPDVPDTAVSLRSLSIAYNSAQEEDGRYKRKVLFWTRGTFWVVCFYALVTAIIGVAAVRQMFITEGQLRVMEIDKRPWVAIDAAIVDTFRAIRAADQNAAMSLTLDFILSNTGEAPAVYVRTWPMLAITGPPGDPLHYSKLLCDHLRTQPITENTATYTIFPGKTLPPLRNSFQTSRQSLEANRTAANGEVLGFVVAGCVDYGFVGRPEHHQTGFAFEVSRRAAAIPGERCCAIDFLGNDVPAADLRVTLYPFGGFYAD